MAAGIMLKNLYFDVDLYNQWMEARTSTLFNVNKRLERPTAPCKP